jgi:ribosome-binding protein aMBF1 (putative translation factor)
MSHQDWVQVKLVKSPKQLIAQGKYTTEAVKRADTSKYQGKNSTKLDNGGDEPDTKINKVSFELKTKIMKARQAKGLKQDQLAMKLGVSSNVIKNYENGTAFPDSRILQLLSRELGVNLSKKD